jgi:hypothetical protein
MYLSPILLSERRRGLQDLIGRSVVVGLAEELPTQSHWTGARMGR